MKKIRRSSPTRGALQIVWDMNIRAIPTALIWSISFWFVLETHSMVLRILAILVANGAALFSGVLIANGSGPNLRSPRKVWLLDPLTWKLLLGTGLILALALENVWKAQASSMTERLFYLSIFISSLILWLFVSVVLVPLRFQMLPSQAVSLVFALSIDHVRRCKPYLLFSFVSLLFGWPFFFVYVFTALTFAQGLTISSSAGINHSSVSSIDLREHLA